MATLIMCVCPWGEAPTCLARQRLRERACVSQLGLLEGLGGGAVEQGCQYPTSIHPVQTRAPKPIGKPRFMVRGSCFLTRQPSQKEALTFTGHLLCSIHESCAWDQKPNPSQRRCISAIILILEKLGLRVRPSSMIVGSLVQKARRSKNKPMHI